MSRQQTLAHYTRLLARWPADALRPSERQFQRLLQSRVQTLEAGNELDHNATKEINAAYNLLSNAFQSRYPLSQKLMRPKSDPEHYEKLAREIEEGPNRSIWGRVMKRMQGMVRWR